MAAPADTPTGTTVMLIDVPATVSDVGTVGAEVAAGGVAGRTGMTA
jgi:hypothetical protein